MAIQRQVCVNHPERAAIGVCVITKRPICTECTTRYEGVNYSVEGLRILREQRAERRASTGRGGVSRVLLLVASPLLAYALAAFAGGAASMLIRLAHHEWREW